MEQIKFKFNYLWQVLLIKLEPTGLEKPSLRKHPFLHALRRWGRFARNVPSGEERGETDVFAGYPITHIVNFTV